MSASPSVESDVSLKPLNTFGLPAVAQRLVRVRSDADVRAVLGDSRLARLPRFILGGGSNVVLTRDLPELVLKVEVPGAQVVGENAQSVIVEFGAGVGWHEAVSWTLDHGLPGLENLALIPGTVGAAPVQNIGAYGMGLQDRLESLDAVDLVTGRAVRLGASDCRFGYRDSVFKRELAGRALISRVRLALPKAWAPVLGYRDLEHRIEATGITHPDARTIFEWVCAIRRAKLPDPALIGNAGSFFKNPVVSPEQCRDIIARDPHVVHYPMDDGSFKLAAGWLIDACGWRGKAIGGAAVHDKQALVLINRSGQATGSEVLTLAAAIQESVYGRFGIRLEREPMLV